MRYLSVCSGIEAATVAWHQLGWEAAAYSEIEAFPRAVLAHHYPDTPLHGDFTTIRGDEYGPVDLLVGGTPCQSFSVAGLRKGMADPRGNLALGFLGLLDRLRAPWVVWENVPGVLSSNGGRDFGAFLGGLEELGYGFAYRILDAQYFGVPQRRRRVFVVGHLGDWRRAAAVLFERHSLSGHPAPRREAGEAAPTLPSRSSGGGGLGTDFDCNGGLICGGTVGGWGDDGRVHGANRLTIPTIANCITTGEGSRMDHTIETLLPVTHTLRADGFDASEDGTGRGTPLVSVLPFDTTQITSEANYSNPKPGDPMHPLAAGAHVPAIAIQERAVSENPNNGPDGMGVRTDGVAYTLEARQQPQAVALNLRGREGGSTIEVSGDVATALRASQGGGDKLHTFTPGMAVRRITPVEAERLMGFPDGYTLVPYRWEASRRRPPVQGFGQLNGCSRCPLVGRKNPNG